MVIDLRGLPKRKKKNLVLKFLLFSSVLSTLQTIHEKTRWLLNVICHKIFKNNQSTRWWLSCWSLFLWWYSTAWTIIFRFKRIMEKVNKQKRTISTFSPSIVYVFKTANNYFPSEMRSHHDFEVQPSDVICNFSVKWSLSPNALLSGDTVCKGPHRLVMQKKHSLGIMVETVGSMNKANEGTGIRLLFSEGKYHFNLWENQLNNMLIFFSRTEPWNLNPGVAIYFP